MRREDFRKWAEHGCRFYGEDPWFFLRELAQNARDAFAGLIKVDARRDGSGQEIIEFEDNGTGMTLEHARRFLFRLYASSKDDDRRSAGKYGIGFWSILRFQPSYILVESRTASGGWGILVDEGFNLSKVECGLDHRGTRITLMRPAVHAAASSFQGAVEAGLKRYCRYLRKNDRKAGKLPVIYRGKNMTRSMRLPGPLSLAFREGPVEGAVGFADTPSVRLYARGLPVWKGAVLDELYHTEAEAPERAEIGRNLSPVFLLNGNTLSVIMSRRAVIDDRELARVRKSARGALARLVELHMDSAFPRPLHVRLLDAVSRAARAVLRIPPAYVIVAIVTVFAAALAANVLSGRLHRSRQEPVSAIPGSYGGAVVEDPAASPAAAIDLKYSPPGEAWFKILTADHYNVASGFVLLEGGRRAAPSAPCRESCISVSLRVGRAGPVTLPMPSGYVLDAGSLRVDGNRSQEVWQSARGDVFVTLQKGALLEYACGPPAQPAALDEAERKRLTELPPLLEIPRDIRKVLVETSGLHAGAKLAASLQLTNMLVAYDVSDETAAVYRDLGKSGAWLPFVLKAGRGDCDVLNGLNALFLRTMGVPARLAVGLVGNDGRILPDLHAWTEYHDGAWRTVDATPLGEAPGEEGADGPSGNLAEVAEGPVPLRISLVAGGGTPSPGSPAAPGALQPPAPPVRAKAVAPAAPARRFDSLTLFLLGLSLLSLAAALVMSVILFSQRRDFEHMERVKDPGEAEQILASMLSSASVHPSMWRHARGLWLHRILPTLEGPRISVVEASRLARRRKLFLGSPGGALAAEAAAAGACVLDRKNPAFGPFLSRLSGVIDLDAIEKYRPAEETRPSLSALLDKTNELLDRAGSGGLRCFASPGFSSGDFRDVDIRSLSLPRGSAWPACFIAVNPSGDFAKACCALFERNPPLAAFTFLRGLMKDSMLLSHEGDRMRRIAAQILVGEAS